MSVINRGKGGLARWLNFSSAEVFTGYAGVVIWWDCRERTLSFWIFTVGSSVQSKIREEFLLESLGAGGASKGI